FHGFHHHHDVIGAHLIAYGHFHAQYPRIDFGLDSGRRHCVSFFVDPPRNRGELDNKIDFILRSFQCRVNAGRYATACEPSSPESGVTLNAVILSTARTPIAKAYRGAFNDTHGATLGAHVISHAVQRAGAQPDQVEDVIMGSALPEGATGGNIARHSLLRAGFAPSVPGVTVNRACGSSLQAIAFAAQRVRSGEADLLVAGGVESVSLVQDHRNVHRFREPWIEENRPDLYWSMIQTADYVGEKYNVAREKQDRFALESQQRAVAAQAAGRFDAEIVPLTTVKVLRDKQGNEIGREEVTLQADEGTRPGTTLESLSALRPVGGPNGCVTAGNASQLSDGASACVVASERYAEKHGVTPLGRYIGFEVAGCEPG